MLSLNRKIRLLADFSFLLSDFSFHGKLASFLLVLGNFTKFAWNSGTIMVCGRTYGKGVIENTNLNKITYEELFAQFLACAVPIPGSAPVPAHDGSCG